MHIVHGFREQGGGIRLGLVLAPAVGRLDENVVRVGEDRWIANDRRVPQPEVA